jgi:hypothetical protein
LFTEVLKGGLGVVVGFAATADRDGVCARAIGPRGDSFFGAMTMLYDAGTANVAGRNRQASSDMAHAE